MEGSKQPANQANNLSFFLFFCRFFLLWLTFWRNKKIKQEPNINLSSFLTSLACFSLFFFLPLSCSCLLFSGRLAGRTQPQATAILQGLRTGIKTQADFAKVAESRSDCSSAKRGGDLGPFARGKMQVRPPERDENTT